VKNRLGKTSAETLEIRMTWRLHTVWELGPEKNTDAANSHDER